MPEAIQRPQPRPAVIIPIKQLREAKTRLAGVLSPLERQDLVRSMLLDVLETLLESSLVDGVFVVTCDPEVRELALGNGARVLKEVKCENRSLENREDSELDLNLALSHAARQVEDLGFTTALILAGDLPLIDEQSLKELCSRHLDEERAGVVVVPDRHNDGSNALLLSPPSVISFRFGPGSARRHLEEAQKNRVPSETLRLSSLDLDIDTPADISELLRRFQTEGTHRSGFTQQMLQHNPQVNELNLIAPSHHDPSRQAP